MKHVMHSMRNSFDNGILMSATEEVNEFFGKIVPGLFTYQRYRPDVIKAFVKKQRKAKIRGQPLQRVFLILEDMMYDKSILRTDKWLAYLFQNGRHLQATLIISSQYAMSLPPEFRSQVGRSLFSDPEFAQFAPSHPRKLFCRLLQLFLVRGKSLDVDGFTTVLEQI